MRSYDVNAVEAQISAWNQHLSTSGQPSHGYTGAAARLFERVGDRVGIDDMIAAVNAQSLGVVVTNDQVKTYTQEHPMESWLGKPRDEIEKLIRAEWKSAKDTLVTERCTARLYGSRAHGKSFGSCSVIELIARRG